MCQLRNTESFEDFILSCVFMHDDTDSSAGVDWDQHGTNPFLLSPSACVVDTLEGFGEPYLDYLHSLGALPETLIIPNHKSASLVDNLLTDKRALRKLKHLLVVDRFDLSVFYPDEDKGKLASALLGENSESRIHPSRSAFSQANDKLHTRDLLRKTKVPIPEGAVCFSVEDLQYFYRQVCQTYPKVLVKKHHWDTQPLCSHEDIAKSGGSLEFPVIAEVAYPVKCSPVSHNLVWRGEVHHLFVVMQKVESLRHAGNVSPTNLSAPMTGRIAEYSRMVIEQVPEFSGVFGIDFIITTNDLLIAVDVNPRFNSSTYPFYFLQRMGLNLENTFAKYGFTKCSMKDLSSLYLHESLMPFSRIMGEGIVLYSPAFDRSRQMVTKFSYVCVSKTSEKLLHLEGTLLKIAMAQGL